MYVAPTISPQSLLAGGCSGCGSSAVMGSNGAGLPGGGSTTYVYTAQGPVSGSGNYAGSQSAQTTLGEPGDETKSELPQGVEDAAGAKGGVFGGILTGSTDDWFLFIALVAVVLGIGLGNGRKRRT